MQPHTHICNKPNPLMIAHRAARWHMHQRVPRARAIASNPGYLVVENARTGALASQARVNQHPPTRGSTAVPSHNIHTNMIGYPERRDRPPPRAIARQNPSAEQPARPPDQVCEIVTPNDRQTPREPPSCVTIHAYHMFQRSVIIKTCRNRRGQWRAPTQRLHAQAFRASRHAHNTPHAHRHAYKHATPPHPYLCLAASV